MPKIPTFTSQVAPTAEVGAVKSNIQISPKSSLAGALLPAANAITQFYVKEKEISNKVEGGELIANANQELLELKEQSKLKSTPEQGVNFFQTQYAFDGQILKKYMDRLKEFNITKKAYYLVGLGVIKSAKSAKWMNKNLFGINIPNSIIQRLENSTNERKEGIKICIELIEKYQEIEGVHGIHLMGYHQEEQIAEVISHFKK